MKTGRKGRKGKVQPDPEFDPEFDWLEENSALYKKAFWLDDPNSPWESLDWPWYIAMEAVDRRGDKSLLIEKLLDGRFHVTPNVRLCLADLLSRYNLVPLPGKQRTPIYDVSGSDLTLLLAIEEVRTHRRDGMPKAKAVEDVARSYDIDPQKLFDALDGKRGSLRRTRKRLALLKPDKLI
jgi:hypothetical protein